MWIPRTQVNAAGGAMQQLYDNIAAGAIASWDVQNLSQAYNHLRVIYLVRGDTAASNITPISRFNNDSGANYDSQYDYGNNPTAGLAALVAQTSMYHLVAPAATATAGKAAMGVIDIANYTGTTFHKVSTTLTGASLSTAVGDQFVGMIHNLWRNTAAIDRFTFLPSSGNFIAGSRLTIYGLL